MRLRMDRGGLAEPPPAPFSSVPELCPFNQRDFTLPPKERRLLYSFPSAKTSGAETFARAAPDITLLRVHFIDNLYRSFYQALSADPLHN